jgi:hypothetical protein
MIYRQFLVMRKAVLVYTAAIVALSVLMLVTQRHWCTNTSLNGYFEGIMFPVMLFASVYGVGLGNASRDGARVFWLIPRPRWLSALELIAADALGIVVSYVLTAAVAFGFFVVGNAVHGGSCAVANDLQPLSIPTALCFAFAMYGWAALVGMIGRRVAYLGLAFLPAALLWSGFAHGDNPLGLMLRAVAWANPFVVWQMRSFAVDDVVAQAQWWLRSSPELIPAMLAAIAVGTCALAVALWQRAEVIV